MKGKTGVLEVLQQALTDELSAVHGYILHAELCFLGYAGLAAATTKRAIEEMKETLEKLMSRILFLEGEPDVQTLSEIDIGKTVEEQLVIGLKDESGAVVVDNQGVAICTKAGDNVTAELLKGNLADEQRSDGLLPGHATDPHQAVGLQRTTLRGSSRHRAEGSSEKAESGRHKAVGPRSWAVGGAAL